LAFILGIFKCREKYEKDENEVKYHENIINATALGTSSDANDLFNIGISKMNKRRRKTMQYKYKFKDDRKNTEILLQTLKEEENEDDDEKEKKNNNDDNKETNLTVF